MLQTNLKKAIQKAGNQSLLAAMCEGVSQQNINYWLNNSANGVPPAVAIQIEAATGVSRYGLVKNAEMIWGRDPNKASAA